MSRRTTKGKKIPSLAPGFSNCNLCIICIRDCNSGNRSWPFFVLLFAVLFTFKGFSVLKKCHFAIYELIWYDANSAFKITREN